MSDEALKQRLAAILAADAVGYSRSMAADERATVSALDAARGVFRSRIESEQGRVIDMAGDSVLAVFDTAMGAVRAALAIQHELASASGAAAQQRLQFRIGLHLGDVFEKADGTVYGDGVNVAARLQALAEPGGVAVSDAVKGAVCGRVAGVFVDQGEKTVKNVPSPLRWHQVMRPSAGKDASVTHGRTDDGVSGLPAIAILPFKVASADPEQASLGDGLRIDVQAALVKISGLVLIAIGTTNTYRNKDVPLQQAATEMGARYVVEGFVQKAGGRVRITVSLVDGRNGQAIWSERYDRVLDDTFEVQDEITERIVTALDVKVLSGEQAKVWRKTLKDPKAREEWYCGIHEFMQGRPEANASSRTHFERVAKIAPQCSLGPTMFAFSHWFDAFRGWTPTPEQSIEIAAEWAERAMTMEDADGQAHAAMGHIHLYRHEHDKALEVAEQAVALRPNCTNANAQLANILHYCGRPADAADRMKQSIRYSPVHGPWNETLLGTSLKELGLWEEAIGACRTALRKKPDDIDARLVMIEAHMGAGTPDAAATLAKEVLVLRNQFTLSGWARTQPYKDPAVLERICAVLRSAGLPD